MSQSKKNMFKISWSFFFLWVLRCYAKNAFLKLNQWLSSRITEAEDFENENLKFTELLLQSHISGSVYSYFRLNNCVHSRFKYGGPQLSHRNQMLTANSNWSLTANSNYSQQIQIAHSELQITHSKLQIVQRKLQIAHSKFKSPTANSNRSQQIKVAHSKFKSLPFCRGSRVFFRVSRVHCWGSYFTLKNVWKSVKRIYIKFAHRVFSTITVYVLIRV